MNMNRRTSLYLAQKILSSDIESKKRSSQDSRARSTIALMINYYSAILPPWAPPPSLTHHQMTQWVISRIFLVIHKINSFVFKMIHSNFLVFYNKNYSLIFLQLVFEFIKHVFDHFLTCGRFISENDGYPSRSDSWKCAVEEATC